MDIPITPTTTDGDPNPQPRPWIESDGGTTNLPAGVSMLEALQCFAPQGINGCGFESQLESMYKTFARSDDANDSGSGFFRAGALPVVIMVTDEVDCSHQNQWAEIFLANGNRVFWSDPNAAYPTSAVCWNAGVECSGGPGAYDACNPAAKDVNGNSGASDDDAVLHALSRYVDRLAVQGAMFAGIVGVPQGYVDGQDIVYQDTADPNFMGDFGIGPGCSSSLGEAVPPVRMRGLDDALSGERTLYSVCDSNYNSAFNAIANKIIERLP